MRILFLHPKFPAQFRPIAAAIARDNRHQVVFGTKRREGSLPGVYKALYQPSQQAHSQTHHYLRSVEEAVWEGQAVYRLAEQLKARGFVPDVIYGHSGSGSTLFCKDIFPKAKLLCYFEWFYHSDAIKGYTEGEILLKNSPILMDLSICDGGISPTSWQRQQFPQEYHSKISVLHDGVDTNYFRPKTGAKLVLGRLNLDLSQVEELVTYVERGMDSDRSFSQFIEAVAILQQRRPNCHVVIVNSDRQVHSKALLDGNTEKLPLDLSRVHFTGRLSYKEHLQVLQASSAHVYLTQPFALSSSMIEAMSAGCLLVASNTAPVLEVIQEGVNGLLVDFFSPQEIALRVEEALNHPNRLETIRTKARETVLARYNLAKLLPLHLRWVQQGMDGPLMFSPTSLQVA